MKKCPRCGSTLKADQRFCPQCGTEVKNVAPQAPVVKPLRYQQHRRQFWQRIGISLLITAFLLAVVWLLSASYNRKCLSVTKHDDGQTIWLVTPDGRTVDQLSDSTEVNYAYRFYYDHNGNRKTVIYSLANAKLGELKLDRGRLTYRSIAKYVAVKEGTYPTRHDPVQILAKQKVGNGNSVNFVFKQPDPADADMIDPSQYQYDSQINLTQSQVKAQLSNGNYAIGYRTRQESDDVDHPYKGYLITLTNHADWQAIFQNEIF